MFKNALKLTVLAFCLLLTAAAHADEAHSKDLAGTWHMTADLGNGPAHAMVTFFDNGTFIHTAPSKNNVNAHGVWKKLRERTFVEQNREYVMDQDGKLILFADTTEIIELSEDGQTFVGEAVAELKRPDDGVVVQVVPFTIYGTRMVLDY